MANKCDIIIHKGKNKGKKCYEINKTCRHQKTICAECGSAFGYKHNFIAHLKQCTGSDTTCAVVAIKKRPYIAKKDPEAHLVTPTIIKRTDIKSEVEEKLLERLDKLEKVNEEFEKKLQDRPSQHVTNINVVILGDNFYEELVSIMGKKDAVHFLAKAASKGKPLDVINKLYLDGMEPNEYPIACRDRTIPDFRYLNDNRQIVNDLGGNTIGSMVSNKIRNAMLLATNEIIHERVHRPITDTESGIYKDYDIVDMQKNLTDMCEQFQIVRDLAEATENKFHPFFLLDDERLIDHTT